MTLLQQIEELYQWFKSVSYLATLNSMTTFAYGSEQVVT